MKIFETFIDPPMLHARRATQQQRSTFVPVFSEIIFNSKKLRQIGFSIQFVRDNLISFNAVCIYIKYTSV